MISLLMSLCICTLPMTGCGGKSEPNWQCTASYDLVAAKVQTNTIGKFSGKFLVCYGYMSGSIENNNTVYKYWYKRSDGGIITDTIEQTSLRKIVVYEDDDIAPKIEIWEDLSRKWYEWSDTEYRFTIPSGTFVNVFDFQSVEPEK